MDVFPSGHDQGRSIFTVTGDIDLGTAEHLLVRLTALIGSARRETGLDLSGVTFIDCAGLRTLIAVDALVRANGATIRLIAISPAVDRLLELGAGIWNTTAIPGAAPTAARGAAHAPIRPSTRATTGRSSFSAPSASAYPAAPASSRPSGYCRANPTGSPAPAAAESSIAVS